MFKDCVEYLKTLNPMNELQFCDDIVLECPTEEKQIKDGKGSLLAVLFIIVGVLFLIWVLTQ